MVDHSVKSKGVSLGLSQEFHHGYSIGNYSLTLVQLSVKLKLWV